VLDLSQLDRSQLDQLLGLFSRLRAQTFAPLPEQFDRAARGDGTRFILDREVLRIVLQEPLDLTPLYELLAREPIVCLVPLVSNN